MSKTVKIVLALLSVAMVVAAVTVLGLFQGRKDEAKAAQQEIVNAKALALSKLEGTYIVRFFESGQDCNTATAAVSLTDTLYTIKVYSEYAPEYYTFCVDSTGTLNSEQLGVGVADYKTKIDRLTIKFTKEDKECVFVR